MDKRGQFTFYRSFWEAVQSLPKKDKLPVLEAIISYALDGDVPSGLSQSQSAFFLLVKPNLDASRKKAANGKQGGSKPKANAKQKQSEIKGEGEKEKEEEEENEIEKEYKCNDSSSSSSAGADEQSKTDISDFIYDLFYRYTDRRPNCRDLDMVSSRVIFGGQLSRDAMGLMEYAFEAAASAGLGGNWNYINAVLDRCSINNIFTADEARAADEERWTS